MVESLEDLDLSDGSDRELKGRKAYEGLHHLFLGPF
jgi:hypothetical protein